MKIRMRKKIICTAIAIVMTIGLLPVFPLEVVSAKTGEQVWDGYSSDKSWYEGDPGQESYTISTAAELKGFADLVNEDHNKFSGITVNLGADIDLDGHDWIPIGCYMNIGGARGFFAGIFDGNGHTVSGLTINKDYHNDNDIYFSGFFAMVRDGAVIQNLFIKDAVFEFDDPLESGILVGHLNSSQIINCHVSGIFKARNTYEDALGEGDYVGGLVGSLYAQEYTSIERCSANVTMDCYGLNVIGGLVGLAQVESSKYSTGSVLISDCFTTGTVTGDTGAGIDLNVSGLVGVIFDWDGDEERITLQNCYTTARVFAEDQGNTSAAHVTLAMDGATVKNCYWESEYPGADVYPGVYTEGNATFLDCEGKSWDEMQSPQFVALLNGSRAAEVWYYKEGSAPTLLAPADYTLNGMNGYWTGGDLTLADDGDEFIILADSGPDDPVKIFVTAPDDSEVTIRGRTEITYENLYIEVTGKDITVNMEDLKYRAPDKKHGLEFTNNGTDYTSTVHVTGDCYIRAGDGTDNTFEGSAGNAVSSYQQGSLTISGDSLALIGGGAMDFGSAGPAMHIMQDVEIGVNLTAIAGDNGRTGANGITSFSGSVLISSGDISIKGSSGQDGGGTGIYARNSIVVSTDGDVEISGGDVATLGNYGAGYGMRVNSAAIDPGYSIRLLSGNIAVKGGKGGDYGSAGIYSTGDIYIDTDVTVESYGGATGSSYAVFAENDIVIDDGAVFVTGGDSETAGGTIGIMTNRGDVTVNGGAVTVKGGDSAVANGAHGIYSRSGDIFVGDGASLTAIGGDGGKNRDGNLGGLGIYAYGWDEGNDAATGKTVTIAAGAGDVYVRGGMGSDSNGRRPSIAAKDVFIATGNVGEITAGAGVSALTVKNAVDGDEVYMLTAETNPLAPNALIYSTVATSVTALEPSYLYRAITKEDGIAYMWLPAKEQTVSTDGYEDGTEIVLPDNSARIILRTAKLIPTVLTPPTATTIYQGEALSASNLTGGVASTEGVFAWSDDTIVPVLGTTEHEVTFTPIDATSYSTVKLNVPVTVIQQRRSSGRSGSSGSPVITPPTASLESGQVANGSTVTLSTIYTDGKIYYTINGTTPTVNSTLYEAPVTIDRDVTIKAIVITGSGTSTVATFTYTVQAAAILPRLNIDTIRYIRPHSERLFDPDLVITRYEMLESLAMLYDIEEIESRTAFSDVSEDYEALVTLFTGAGVLDGFPDGTFRGDQGLTRAEFVKIMTVILDLNPDENSTSKFTDMAGHWAGVHVAEFEKLNYIAGYPDNTFKPDVQMTRAEFVSIVNRITGMKPSVESPVFEDLPEGHWAYGSIMAAYIK